MKRAKRIAAAVTGAAVAVAAVVILAVPVTPPPGISGGKFETTCQYSHSSQEDPIVSPGLISAHLHDFFGNRATNRNSTPASLVGGRTTCKLAKDSAAYWVPAAYRSDTGERVYPVKIFAYYFGTKGPVESLYPAGLKMLSGNSKATQPSEAQNISFSCGGGGNTASPTRAAPYNCLTTAGVRNSDGVVAIIRFPVCWDGQGLEPANVTMPGGDGNCPGLRFTQLQIRVHYGTGSSASDFQRGDLLTFSSGPWYTLHADFMNGWDQPKLDSLVTNCQNYPDKDCGFVSDARPGP